MELAQALILTNALGGFSSLGRTSDRRDIPHGGLMSLLDGYYVEVVCRDAQLQVFLFAEETRPPAGLRSTTPGPLRALPGTSLLPGRLLLQSPQGIVAVPLSSSGDHLAADVQYPDDHILVAVELMVRGKPQRTAFAPLIPPVPDEA
jgi:hypothetical protein